MADAKKPGDKTHIFVISDLHLGGAPASDGKPAFQMCTEAGRAQLERFITWATGRLGGEWDVQLVVAGDIVDFLAEEREGGFQAFTRDDAQATEKLRVILNDTAGVWRCFANIVQRGGALTLMLGNHDLELSLPGPRRLLLDTLGPGRVEFIYDNQAFTFSDVVLVEHGNRYDDWNAVPHDDLRETRSRLSRGETSLFDPLPGSLMVTELVNPTKKELAFVDLLKPQDAALLPFLALLAPNRYEQVKATLKNRIRALRVRYGPGQQPKDRNFVGLDTEAPAVPPGLGTGDAEDDALVALADAVAAGGDAAMVGAVSSFVERWKDAVKGVKETFKKKQLDLLLDVLRAFRGTNTRAFDVGVEEEKYLQAATESAANGFKVIVYGHTHLPKRISLAGRKSSNDVAIGPGTFYLNSGTWADLMALPAGLLAPEKTKNARELLEIFANDLAHNRLESWRRQLPTFAAIDVEGGRVTTSEVQMLADGESPVAIDTKLVEAQLQREAK
jgi:UDP-2,3-diacylglucosamine pyrophosphatase LpxH